MARFVKTLHGKSLQTISKIYHCIVMSIQGTMPIFNLFWLIIHFRYFQKQKKSSLQGSNTMLSHIVLPIFLAQASTCGEDRKTDFCNHFCTVICVLVVQIWITCIKCKENAVNHLNIANEPQKRPNLHGNEFIAYVDHTKNIIFK